MFRLLLSAGAEVDCRDQRGYTPLHIAVKKSADISALLLLDYGADVNAQGIGTFRKSPIHRARTPRMVQILLQAGANPYATMDNSQNAYNSERVELSAFEVNRSSLKQWQ